ncbi:MAG: prepilin-type N-terminal cleavage/methylation domain-containing protein [Clostridiales bacterium]|nr:prepilin-type N-terminal cleavage/methylation domain-containing protein [Clostridiales bacterium]
MKNKKNSGFTLIELIVIIAIMAVLTGSFAVSLALISRQKVANAGNSMKQLIQLAQTYARSKDNCLVAIEGTSEGDSNVYIYTYDDKDVTDRSKWKLGNGPSNINKKITTIVEFENGKSVTISDGVVVYLLFNRTTGGFEPVEVPGYPDPSDPSKNVKEYPSKIVFTNGSKTTKLVLAKHTGVITFESQNS